MGLIDETIARALSRLPAETMERLQAEPGATLRPPTLAPAPAAAALPSLPTASGDLEVRGTLGEGGMGRVLLAHQRSLGRDVAVKSLLPHRRSAEAEAALLAEGRFAGSLEHPNIVPVHALGRDHDGAALLVMKRLEGSPWRDRLASLGLERNLEILLQVCNAVHFAHSRGVLHRDIKPDNVILGDFGEVTLVDWGIALRLAGREAATDVAGTPCYMAPEMLTGGLDLSPRTDVYLLGATLHELLTGRPPHQGGSLRDLFASVAASAPPSFEASVPEALGAICQRALHPVPQRRHESAAALRDDLQAFLRHRASARLADEALGRLVEARVAPDRAASRRLLAEAQFGLRQALREWPDNGAARQGLRDALAQLALLEIAEGNRGAAELLLSELPDPPAEVSAALSDLIAKKEAEDAARRRIEALEREEDIRVSTAARVALAASTFLGSVIMLCYAELRGPGAFGPRQFALLHLISTLIQGSILVVARRALFRNQFNRHNALSIFGLSLVLLLHAALAAWRDQPVWETVTDGSLLLGLAMVMIGIMKSAQVLPLAATILAAAAVPRLHPEWAYRVWGVVTTIPWLGILLGWLSTRRRQGGRFAQA